MIDVICPSRGRPIYCKEMVESVLATATGDVRIVIGLDDDDPTIDEYGLIEGVTLDIGAQMDVAV